MLSQIQIRNYTIVAELDLEFEPGMTVLTGETGAGKSILLDALALALGDRADADCVRHGASRADISVAFRIDRQADVRQWLADNELDDGSECLLRRTIGADGRSKGFINSRPVALQSLRELGELLVDIHGQHAHQSLLKRDMQRQSLDDYAGHGDLLDKVRAAYQHWATLHKQRQALARTQQERSARLELLRYQTDELDTTQLAPDEMPQLEDELRRLANVSRLQQGSGAALTELYDADEGAIVDRLNRMVAELESLQELDDGLAPAVQLLQAGVIQTQEAAAELRDYVDRLSVDPQRLHDVEERIATLSDLARKHRVNPEALPQLLVQLREELRELDASQSAAEHIDQALAKAESDYQTLAQQLTKSRAQAAKKLAKLVADNMAQLGMPHGQFHIAQEPLTEYSPHGLEGVEFLVTTNPGQAAKPLGKVASGGELSRISLALQVITAKTGRIPTLIFDEVDVGIGGGTAEIVGRLLRDLSAERQVLCVTHQPQVAALAHQHLLVRKQTAKGATYASVASLSPTERIEEVARMLGGIEITAQTRSHASEMIERAAV